MIIFQKLDLESMRSNVVFRGLDGLKRVFMVTGPSNSAECICAILMAPTVMTPSFVRNNGKLSNGA